MNTENVFLHASGRSTSRVFYGSIYKDWKLANVPRSLLKAKKAKKNNKNKQKNHLNLIFPDENDIESLIPFSNEFYCCIVINNYLHLREVGTLSN